MGCNPLDASLGIQAMLGNGPQGSAGQKMKGVDRVPGQAPELDCRHRPLTLT